MRFQIYSRLTLLGRRWYWRLRARNGEMIASGEGYNRKEDCRHAVSLVRQTGLDTPVEELP